MKLEGAAPVASQGLYKRRCRNPPRYPGIRQPHPHARKRRLALTDLIVASPDNDRNLDADSNGRVIIPAKATSDEYLALMNRKHAVTREGGKVVVAEFVGKHEIEYSTPREIEQFYRNVRIPMGDGATKPLGHWWLDHEKRRQYEAIVFEPGDAGAGTGTGVESNRRNPHVYNRWRGLSLKPKPGDWSLYYDNLLNNMCGGNLPHCNYVLDWMAHGVQHPEEKPGVAIVFRSDERGTGKSTVCRYYSELFGAHGLEVSSTDHLTGRFNGHLETLIVLVVNEAIWAGDHSSESVLKALITEPNITIENKHRAVQQRPSYLRVMMTANSSWVVPAGWSERRFLVLEASDRMVGKAKYWSELSRQMKKGGSAGFLHDLLARDLANFNPRSVPVTVALIDQKIQSMDDATRWIYNCLARGKWSLGHGSWKWDIGRNELYDLYINEAPKISSRKTRAVQTELGKLVGKIFPGANDGPRIRLAGERVRTYSFSGLEESRRQFARFMQAPDTHDLFIDTEPDNQVQIIDVGNSEPGNQSQESGTLIDFQSGRKLPTDTQK